MKRNYIFLSAIIFTTLTSCSIHFTLKDTFATPRESFLTDESIQLIFFDSRPDKRISEHFENILVSHLNRSYPSAKVNVLSNEYFFQPVEKNKLTLKINLTRLSDENVDIIHDDDDSTCSVDEKLTMSLLQQSADESVATTVLEATLYDYRNGQQKFSEKIVARSSASQIMNKKLLNRQQVSVQRTLNKLCVFIDKSLME